ncbi:MAG: DUF4382 domain-containing protein [Gemmatimonadales bacterium]
MLSRSLERTARGLLLACLVGTVACSDSTAPGSGTLSLLLTDAPGDLKAAVVTISEIDLQGSGGTQVLSTTPTTTDLLTLAGSAQSLVQGALIPAGTYTQLRFVITGGYIEVEDLGGGSSIYASSPNYAGLPAGAQVAGPLRMPSFAQSGLKVTLPGNALTITDGGEKVLLVDFDVSQSFGHLAGQSGMWVMHPVVQATDVTVSGGFKTSLELGTGVTLPGTVLLGDFSAVLTASDNSTTTVPFTDPNSTGVFEAQFDFLAPGSYTLSLPLPAGVTSFTTTPAVPLPVTVSAGQQGSAALTLTAVN